MLLSHQRCLVDESGQSYVMLGQAPTVMCAEGDLHLGGGHPQKMNRGEIT